MELIYFIGSLGVVAAIVIVYALVKMHKEANANNKI